MLASADTASTDYCGLITGALTAETGSTIQGEGQLQLVGSLDVAAR